jgi:gliding motility-associated-like protein
LVCPGDSVELTILDGEDYFWSWTPTTGLSVDTGDTVIAKPDVTVTYTATGVGICGTIEREVTVEVPSAPVANAGADQSICPGDIAQLDGSGGVTYEWTPPVYLDDVTLEDPESAPLTNMFYSLIVTDINGCKDTDVVSVTLFEPAAVDAGEDQYMIVGGFAELNASGVSTYSWDPDSLVETFDDPTTSAFPSDTTVFYVTGTDANGCVSIDSVTVYVLEDMSIATPNAFSPNGDGINDYYHPIFIGLGQVTSFYIYDRWGALLFASENSSERWDGTYQGVPQEIGSYLVVINAENLFGKHVEFTTILVLVR